MKFFYRVLIFSLIVFFVVYNLSVADLSSTNFTIENPSTVVSGGEASSSSFQYFGTTSQLVGGQSTSTNFVQNSGFLYFPTATSPVVSATPSDGQVALTWTPAIGILANITSYQLGISTVSGGPYTYTLVGNVSASNKSGLVNGTMYFFKVRSYAAGLLLSESAEVNATPVSNNNNNNNNGGGGGGGGGGGNNNSSTSQTGVIFSGRAYPLSKVSILKDGQLALTTIAGPDSKFSATLSGLSSGNYTFSVYGEDKNGLRSVPFTFQVFVTSGVSTNISGIFIAPTISVDKSEVKKGDNITIFGQSAPSSQVVISIHSDPEYFENVQSDANGVYLQNFDTSVLQLGQHVTKSKALVGGEISSFGDGVSFTVGAKNVASTIKKQALKGDVNGDGKVNLVDFSIVAFWYNKKNPPDKVDLNHDGVVNLVDFSIMAFYWTG